MRWSVLLALAACEFSPPGGQAGDDADADPATGATNLRWDTTGIPTALWDLATVGDRQAIQLYTDPACITALGAPLELAGADAMFVMPPRIGGAMAFSIDTITASGTLSSGCSPDVGVCPINYERVADSTFAPAFCLAKYESRNVDGIAQPIYPALPWGDVTTVQALAACSALGSRYHLTTNPEWMATAREIEAVPANWSTTVTPFLKKGHTDDCLAQPVGAELAASTDDDPCNGTLGPACAQSNSADFRYNRTFALRSGRVIWDFSGNSFEILDHGPMTNATQGDNPGTDINETTGAAFTPAFPEAEYKSANTSHRDSSQNVGVLFREDAITSTKLVRGGDFCLFAGIYSVALLTSDIHHNVGFRCVYR
ncbi:MAG TPA: hypothetical protein VIU61_16105 [Kofleriaceae bacterium]